MPPRNILIVEDDTNILRLIDYHLSNEDFMVIKTTNSEDALKVIEREKIDIIILDLMLPGMSGTDFLKKVRSGSSQPELPVIILTAKGEEIDRIIGFEFGADDYMIKPFSPRELVLRVKAVLKRSSPKGESTGIVSHRDIVIDRERHLVTVRNKRIELTPMEFKLLACLMERKGRLQTRERLLADVWDMNAEVDTRTVDAHIKRLREKLAESGNLIETVRGFGYRFRDE